MAGCDLAVKLAGLVRQERQPAGVVTMSEFKFACPVCGQHITCDTRSSGSQMECPTCFRKLVVPRTQGGGSSSLLIHAAEVSTRPATQTAGVEPLARPVRRPFPYAAIAVVIILSVVAGGAYVFRDHIKKVVQERRPAAEEPPANPARKSMGPPADDRLWTLRLKDVKIPSTPAAGRVHGEDFLVERATLQGGTLNLRQGPAWPPDLGVTVNLFAKRGEDLAGQVVQIEATRTNAPRVTLRWKNEAEQPVTKTFRTGYALRLEFGPVAGDRLPGKVYLCTPDDAKSYVAGTFTAEIRKPAPPKTTPNPTVAKP